MATNSPRTSSRPARPAAPAKPAKAAAPRARTTSGSTASRTKAKAGSTRAKATAAKSAGTRGTRGTRDTTRPARRSAASTRAAAHLTPAQRDQRFQTLLHTTCLKAGAAAGISALSSRLPLIGRLAPVVLGSIAEVAALARIQETLVQDTLAIYGLELGELEERGVILLATAANVGAQQLSRQTVTRLVEAVVGRIGPSLVSHVLPWAGLVAEVAGAIASTYAVGKRAQALCRLSQAKANDIGELLRGLTGIDERRLLSWTGEALTLALSPLRRALSGFGLVGGRR